MERMDFLIKESMRNCNLLTNIVVTKHMKEFTAKSSPIAEEYYDYLETEDFEIKGKRKKKMQDFIFRDPDFLEPYLTLVETLEETSEYMKAAWVMEDAYAKAFELIGAEDGNWPELILWEYEENRPILSTIFNRAISLYDRFFFSEALEIFRKLMAVNPTDELGVRFYILGIRLKMSLIDYETKVIGKDESGQAAMDWFDDNRAEFEEEFKGLKEVE